MILADWYFLNCLSYPPQRAETLLAIYEALESTRVDAEDCSAAAVELAKEEAWPKIYAVPKLLHALRHQPGGGEMLAGAVMKLLQSVAELAPQKAQKDLERMIQAAFSQEGLPQALRHGKSAAARFAPAFDTEILPYLNIGDRTGEMIVLSIMEYFATGSANLEPALTDALASGPLAELVEAALDGRLGRAAGLVALRLEALRIGPGAQRGLGNKLLVWQGGLPLHEPDLLEALARLRLPNGETMKAEITGLAVFCDLKTFFRAHSPTSVGPLWEQVSARLGIQSEAEAESSTSVMLWQAVVSMLLAGTEKEMMAGLAERSWMPPPEPGSIALPLRVQPLPTTAPWPKWAWLMEDLAALRQPLPPKVFFVKTDVGSPHQVNRQHDSRVPPLVISPWIMKTETELPPSEYWQRKRPGFLRKELPRGWREHAAVLRLCAGVITATKLLEVKTEDADATWRPTLLRLLAHFEDTVGRTYYERLRNSHTNEVQDVPDRRTLPTAAISLALFVRLQVRALTLGYRSGGRPRDFADLCTGKPEDLWLDEILVGWVEEASLYEGVAPSMAEWQRCLPHFAERVAMVRHSRFQVAAALLLRLYSPNRWSRTYHNPGWQVNARNKVLDSTNKPLVHNRQILLTPLETWDEWQKFGHLTRAPANMKLRLTAAVERLLVSYDLADEECEKQRTAAIGDLEAILAQASAKEDTDHFTLLRLLELSVSSSLSGHDVLRHACVALVLERSGSTSARRLTEVFLAAPTDISSAKAWPLLRRAVMRGLAARAFVGRTDEANARSPQILRQEGLEMRFVESLVRRFLIVAASSQVDRLQMRQDYMQLRASAPQRRSPCWFEIAAAREENFLEATLPPGAPFLQSWMLRQALEDPLTGNYVLGYTPTKEGNGETTLVAQGGGPGTGMVRTLEGGWVTRGIEVPDAFPGTPACLDAGRARLLGLTVESGTVVEVEVRRNNRHRLMITPCLPGEVEMAARDLSIWDTDLSRSFWELREDGVPPSSRRVWAQQVGDTWEPEVGSLSEFLCRSNSAGGDPKQTLVFLWGKEVEGGAHWHFAGHPGERYFFQSFEFTLDAAARIRHKLETLTESETFDEAGGMLVSVEAVEIGGQVLLALVDEPWADALHPSLRCPFDDRNLIWRHQFRKDTSAIVVNDPEKGWIIAVGGQTGFPASVRVQWSERIPSPNLDQAYGVVVGWTPKNQREGEVVMEKAGASLELGQDLDGLYERMIDLCQGQLTTLHNKPYKNQDAGYTVDVWNTDGVRLPLVVESLTLRPVNREDWAEHYPARRAVVLSGLRWDKLMNVRLMGVPILPEGLSLADGRHEAVLVSVPPQQIDGEVFRFLFKTEAGCALYPLRFQGLRERTWFFLGARLGFRVSNGQVFDATLQNVRISTAAALWQVETVSRPPGGACFVGECESGMDEPMWALELPGQPGVLLLCPENGVCPQLFARWHATKKTWENGMLPESWQARHAGPVSQQWQERHGRRFFPACLVPVKEVMKHGTRWNRHDFLPGISASPPEGGLLQVHRILLHVVPSREKGLVQVVREFVTERIKPTEVKAARASSTPARLNLNQELEQLEPLQRCLVDRHAATGILPVLRQKGFSDANSRLPVSTTGQLWVPSGAGRYNLHDGQALLLKLDEGWHLDFRLVPPASLKDYQIKLNKELNERVRPEALFFVGILGEQNPYVWRFETGYGQTVDVDEDQLRFQAAQGDEDQDRPERKSDKEFKLRQFLFHGDRITEFQFIGIKVEGQEGDRLCMNLTELAIEHSPARTLYRQAKDFQMVHLLHLTSSGQEVRIASIECCDQRSMSSMVAERLEVPHACLGKDSSLRISERMTQIASTESEIGQPRQTSIYGRLDVKTFDSSQGQTLRFHHVRIVFDENTGLRSGDLLLLQVDKVKRVTNDAFLVFSAMEGVESNDVGVKKIVVMSRAFSLREALLRRLAREEDKGGLPGQIFAVKVYPHPKRPGTMQGFTRTGIPWRHTAALRGHVAKGTGPVFGIVLKLGLAIVLEHRPGIMFRLTAEDFEGGVLPHLDDRSRVRVEVGAKGHIRLRVCQFGDSYYFGSEPRPVVALPHNPLLNTDVVRNASDGGDEWWYQHDGVAFSLGDFASTSCTPCVPNEREGAGLSLAQAMAALMSQPHPKLARAMLLHEGTFRERAFLLPGLGRFVACRLSLAPSRDPEMVPLYAGGELEPLPLNWLVNTFTDAAATQLRDRFIDSSWRYHDEETGYWLKDGVQEQIVPEIVPVQTVETGPLFSERDVNGVRLRYKGADLRRWAVPCGEPVDTFGQTSLVLSVAGSVEMEDRQQAGLYLEHAPGRIIHVPGELFFWRLPDHSLSLGLLDWRHFGRGDVVTVRAQEGEVLSPGHLYLENWVRGPRACFGRSAVLPVLSSDPQAGALELGAGAFRLTVPAQTQISAIAVRLSPDNDLWEMEAGSCRLERGDCCLIGLQPGTQKIVVLGLDVTALPHRESGSAPTYWHGLEQRIFLPVDELGKLEANWAALRELIKAAGGALPATVEGHGASEAPVYFSFRLQDSSIAPLCLAQVMVLGLVPARWSENVVVANAALVLRVGRGVRLLPFAEVVRGVPFGWQSLVAAELAREQTRVWLSADDQGMVRGGIAAAEYDEAQVTPEMVLENEQGGWGLLVRITAGQHLAWVFRHDAAWTDLTALQARQQFLGHARSYVAKRLGGEDAPLGLTMSRVAEQESDSFRPGRELLVLPRFRANEDVREESWLAESHSTGLLLQMTGHVSEPGKPLPVEIAESRRGRRGARQWQVRAVLPGRRSFRLILPAQALEPASESTWDKIVTYAEEAAILPWNDSQLGASAGAPDEQRLVHAFEVISRHPQNKAAAAVARSVLDSLAKAPLVSLPVALMALHILASHLIEQPDEHAAAGDFGLLSAALDGLGSRALRSFHMELLVTSRQTLRTDPDPGGTAASSRFERLLQDNAAGLGEEQMSRLTSLVRFASLGAADATRKFAVAIGMAAGQFPPLEVLNHLDDYLLPRLAGCRTLFSRWNGMPPPLRRDVAQWLHRETGQLLAKAQTRGLDCVLLPPLLAVDLVHGDSQDALEK